MVLWTSNREASIWRTPPVILDMPTGTLEGAYSCTCLHVLIVSVRHLLIGVNMWLWRGL